MVNHMAENLKTLMEPLTDLQRKFVKAYVELGGNIAQASKHAGYATRQSGEATAKLPHVMAAIHAEREFIIKVDIGTLGLAGIRKLLTDDKTPAHVLFQASKYALSIAGHCEALPDSKDEVKNKPLAEMSLDELKEYVAKGKVILEAIPMATARTIDIESPPAKAVSVE
jgi:phage terminase small subunit